MSALIFFFKLIKCFFRIIAIKQQTDIKKYATKVCVYTDITMENRKPQIFQSSCVLPGRLLESRGEFSKKLKDTPIQP